MAVRIGELLLKEKKITPTQLQEALGDLPSQVTVAKRHVDIASWFAGAGGLLVAIAVGLSLWWNRVHAPHLGR